jgi:hypothetical protein
MHGIVIGFVCEGEGNDALLFEVSFVDTCEGFGEDDAAAEVARL